MRLFKFFFFYGIWTFQLMPLIEGLFPIFATAENEEGTIDTVFEALEAITERDDSDME